MIFGILALCSNSCQGAVVTCYDLVCTRTAVPAFKLYNMVFWHDTDLDDVLSMNSGWGAALCCHHDDQLQFRPPSLLWSTAFVHSRLVLPLACRPAPLSTSTAAGSACCGGFAGSEVV